MNLIGFFKKIVRGRLHSFIFSHILKGYYFFNPFVRIGSGTFLSKGISMNVKYGGNIDIGKNCELQRGCQLITYGGNISIGDKCSVNAYSLLYGQGNLKIGNCVRIGAQCVIIPSCHNYFSKELLIVDQGVTNKGIIIEDDVWIGAGARILDGVTVAKGCVIGAGCVVIVHA